MKFGNTKSNLVEVPDDEASTVTVTLVSTSSTRAIVGRSNSTALVPEGRVTSVPSGSPEDDPVVLVLLVVLTTASLLATFSTVSMSVVTLREFAASQKGQFSLSTLNLTELDLTVMAELPYGTAVLFSTR